MTVGKLKEHLTSSTAKIALLLVLLIGAIYPLNAHAADATHAITYLYDGKAVTKTYAAGSAVTLDSLPPGAIAWCDDNDPNVTGGKMAYVGYDRQITVNRDMTLRADYGSYANGALGPRLIQFHLELKYYENDIDSFLEFQQQYNNINAPAGYWIHLPDKHYFDPIQFTATPPVDLQEELHIHKWVYDAAYTGGSIVDETLLHDPSDMIFVDPNDYNQIYNVMVDPSFTITEPAPGSDPVVLPSPLPRNTVQFTVSQKDLPEGGGFTAAGNDYLYNPSNDTSTNVYMQRPVNGLTWGNTFTSNPPPSTYDLLPVPVDIPGYTWQWLHDDSSPTLSEVTTSGDSLSINASHHYVLQYVPDTPFAPVVITADRKTFIWNGAPHTASGYTTTGLQAGHQVVFEPRIFGARTAVTATDVGTYPLIMSPRDFQIEDEDGNIVAHTYSITVIGGGLTILPITPGAVVPPSTPDGVNPPNTGLATEDTMQYLVAFAGGVMFIILAVVIMRKSYKRA